MTTYNRVDSWSDLWHISEELAAADPNEDCLSVLCTLSKEGRWIITDQGESVYHAPVASDETEQITETGILPIESYSPGDNSIPSRVARRLGLGEYVVCNNAGNTLQGDAILDRMVYRVKSINGENQNPEPATLNDMLQEDSAEDIYWAPLEWRHLQSVVDESGSQSDRFYLLAAILRRLAEARMDSETFVPYGNQFADSDFIDSI